MIKKMCPVCDLPVNAGNYCPRCRKVIRNPYKQEINYYLNEGHPENDAECEYHHPHLEPDYRGKAVDREKSGKKTLKNTGKSAEKPSARRTFALIAVWVILLTVAGINAAGRRSSDTCRTDENSSEESCHIVSLSPEEVRAAGVPCNSASHFPVDGSAVRDALRSYILGSGNYLLISEDIFPNNYSVRFEKTEDSTYYGTEVSFYLAETLRTEEEPEDGAQYVSIDYDTGDGTMHQYTSALSDPQASVNFLREFLTRTEELCGFSEEECHAASITELAEEVILGGQGGYLSEGIFDVSIYTGDGQTRINVYYNDADALYDAEL